MTPEQKPHGGDMEKQKSAEAPLPVDVTPLPEQEEELKRREPDKKQTRAEKQADEKLGEIIPGKGRPNMYWGDKD